MYIPFRPLIPIDLLGYRHLSLQPACLGTVARSGQNLSQGKALGTYRLLARYQLLMPREQQVLPFLVSRLLNKQAAGELGISEYTVQVHHENIMRKMEDESFASLV
jgi:FixJ family two-component response regulator